MNKNIIKISRLLLFVMLIGLCPGIAGKEILRGADNQVHVFYENNDDGTISIIGVKNHLSRRIFLKIDDDPIGIRIEKNNNKIKFENKKIARKKVRFDYATEHGEPLWSFKPPIVNDDNPTAEKSKEGINEANEKAKTQPAEAHNDKKEQSTKYDKKDNDTKPTPAAPQGRADKDIEEHRPADNSGGYKSITERLKNDAFFGETAVNDYCRRVDDYIKGLSEADNKAQFLVDNNIAQFLRESESELAEMEDKYPAIAAQWVSTQNKTSLLEDVVPRLSKRLKERKDAYNRLRDAVCAVESEAEGAPITSKSIINYAIIGFIALIMLTLVVFAVKRKKKKTKLPQSQRAKTMTQQPHDNSDEQVIVVRRRTTSILKKQCIDDVKDNPDYLHINASEFTQNSAVRSIYIKSSCIKEVYNLYAEDLRNSGNPKEDGCMVLGRWVYDENTNTYDVTMETAVFPGDDAVFKEYELNFGGKIKLRVAEKLRKLRRDTNLQYDLVCWIHSHPGLGVFFSNSDVNVQMQLKHAQHPNFLIAFVIDILTSTQEIGIFTFRHDGTMNSKADLTKLYSLEEMYKWTLDSERASFSSENYYNVLKKSKMQMPSCCGIELNNSSIIDLSQIVPGSQSGLVGRVVGTSFDADGRKEYVVTSIAKSGEGPGVGVIGLLLNVAHISLPTIQRLIAGESGNIAFVMVYSSRQNTVTSIPVINGELIMDEHFYGEETIDDLKIWTRRKR